MFLNSISVVLCGDQNDFCGATIAWATKVEKEHLLVSLPRLSAVATTIEKQHRFSVNVLSEFQENIARQFGGHKQSKPLPVNELDLDFSNWKVPVVTGARAQYLCDLYQIDTLRAQRIITASILDSVTNESLEPLIYHHHKYFSD